MRTLAAILLATSVAACSMTLDTTGKRCTQDADCADNQICSSGECRAGASQRTCVPDAYRQCDGSDIRSFNSCDVDEGVVESCPVNADCTEPATGEAACVCRNQWQGADCSTCPSGWDSGNDCATCALGYDSANDCTSCLGHRDPAASCTACESGWAEVDGNNCATCVRFVDLNAAGAGNGLTWNDAFTLLQAGIDAAAAEASAGRGNLADPNSCELWVRAGTFAPTAASGTSRSFLVPTGVRIYGGFPVIATGWSERDFAGAPTVLDGGGTVFHVVTPAGDAVLDGVSITGGRANGSDANATLGAGVLINGGSPTLRNCRIENNATGSNLASDGYGGGLAAIGGATPTIDSCAFVNNTSEFGGGAIYGAAGTTVTLLGSSFNNNRTAGGMGGGGNGGAIYLSGNAAATISTSVFAGNSTNTGLSSVTTGGALLVSAGVVSVTDSTFDGNSAGNGGAIGMTGAGSLTIEGCEVLSNTAAGTDLTAFGGGMFVSAGTATIRRTTFEGNNVNFVRSSGGGLYLEGGTIELINVIIRDNVINGGPYANGGAVFVGSGVASVAFVNSTIYGNTASATSFVGGIYLASSATPLQIINTIVWGNSDPGINNCCSSTATQTVENSNFQDVALKVGPNTLSYDDPMFVGGGPYDLHLAGGSPRIDGGASPAAFSLVPNVDIEGTVRPQGGGYDLGAYEYVP